MQIQKSNLLIGARTRSVRLDKSERNFPHILLCIDYRPRTHFRTLIFELLYVNYLNVNRSTHPFSLRGSSH